MSTWSDFVPFGEEKKNYSADNTGFGAGSYYTGALASNDNIPWDDSLFHDKHENPQQIRPLGWEDFGVVDTTSASSSSAIKPLTGSNTEVRTSRFGSWVDSAPRATGGSSRFGPWVDYDAAMRQSVTSAPSTTVWSNIGQSYNNTLQAPQNPIDDSGSRFGGWTPKPVKKQSLNCDWSIPSTTMADVLPSYNCNWSGCSASFLSEDLRKQHIENAHMEKDYLCGFCDQEFVTELALKCHLNRNHPFDGADPLLKEL